MYVASAARYINNAGSIVLRRLRKAMPVWTIVIVLAFIGIVSHLPGTTAQAFADTSNAQGVSVDAGGSGDGGSFVADKYYSAGLTASNTTGSNGLITFSNTVAHPIPQADWNTYRYLENTYQVPNLTPGGVYQVRLYFLDWYFTKVGQRVFNVDINGAPVLQNFDIVQAAVNAGGDGQYIGVEKDFTATADANGTVTVQFIRGSADQPMVNAIAVVPSS